MNQKAIFFAVFTAVIILVYGAFITFGGIINTGSGLPPGLYLKIEKPIGIGKYVMFCPPNQAEFQEARDRGYISGGSCPDNFASMMLKVAAKRKDKVSINNDGVFVNDVLLPESKPRDKGKDDKPMPKQVLNHYELKDNEILLMTDSGENPFDGRYFGVIDLGQIDSVISPFLQW